MPRETVPAGVHEGGATIMGSSHGHNEHVLLAMDAGTYNVRKATCGAFCQTCNGVTGWSFVDNPFAVAVSDQHQQTLYETWNSGSQYNDNSISSWTTSNSGVATVQTRGNTSPGLVKGVSAGSSTISAQAELADPQYLSYWCENYQWSCPLTDVSPSGSSPGTVLVPAGLKVLNDTQVINMNYISGCTNTGSWGILIAIHYQVVDSNNVAIPSVQMEPQEEDPDLGLNSWSDIGSTNYPGTSQYTDPKGQFWDAPLGTCSNVTPFSGTDTQYISILLNGQRYDVRTNNWSTTSSFPGHGNITNGNDVSKSR